ncbi:Arginine/ornithine antiporter [Candidatus Kinetoplastibacterium sorsogonicusi]|uniref:Arginine/ornithine antiporter n=1 Tax=Candidatus Kinetoplastidibacterium kentomonadis TaxID=1576550 RepID=A0A3Q8ERK6_9PROT|nr:basic amino acid/polyamine antiporter [Candidatus Kinetoplastibacterium sorsogonicusi]AWD32612.1 Arginine/ornithine antiporter [Candidatus Kinetoplastibacterium sorsogonicusi]
MNSSNNQKSSLMTLTAMVIGSMVGAGIFSLPQNFAQVTGPFGALIAWLISGIGMLMLAFVFQTLSIRKPNLDAGIYAYAKDGFGSYLGFSSVLGYWAGTCLGNVTYFIIMCSTIGYICPSFGNGNTITAILFSSVILWGFHFLILKGTKGADFVNNIVTISKMIPIIIFIFFVAFYFDHKIFMINFWGNGENNISNIFLQVRDTMMITVFVFLGIEGASIYSRYAKNRKDVGIATLLGFISVLCLLIMVTILPYGVMYQNEISELRNPSMAGILEHLIGYWGAALIITGLLISVLGAFLSWTLLATEILFIAAKDEAMPKFLCYENKNQVPSTSLWMTNITVQLFLFITIFSKEAFILARDLTSSMNLIPYLLVAMYCVKLTAESNSIEYKSTENLQKRFDFFCGITSTIYATWLIYAGGLKFLLLSSIIYGPGSVLFIITRLELSKNIFTNRELILCIITNIGSIIAVYGLMIGYISI